MQVCNWKKQRNGHPDCTLTSLQEYYRCIYQPWFKMHGVDNDQGLGVHSSIPLLLPVAYLHALNLNYDSRYNYIYYIVIQYNCLMTDSLIDACIVWQHQTCLKNTSLNFFT